MSLLRNLSLLGTLSKTNEQHKFNESFENGRQLPAQKTLKRHGYLSF